MSSITTDHSTVRWSLNIPLSRVREMRYRFDNAFERRDDALRDRGDRWADDTDSLIAACVMQHALSKLSRNLPDRDVIGIVADVIGVSAFRDDLDLIGEWN